MARRGKELLPWLSLLIVVPLAVLMVQYNRLADAAFILLFIPLLWACVASSPLSVVAMTAVASASRIVLEYVHESYHLPTEAHLSQFLLSCFSAIALYVALASVFLMYRHRQWKLQRQLLAKERLEAMGHLAGGLAHDFNNVLSVILGTVQVMQMDKNLAPSVRADLDTIADATKRGAFLVGQFMGIRHAQRPAKEILDLNQLMEDSYRHVKPAMGSQVDLDLHPFSGPLSVYANATQLHQMILNLCTNARDAMNDVGRIVLATDRRQVDGQLAERKRVPPGEYAVLSVADTGHGMSAKTMSRIFKPFFTTKSPDQGTGLGLAVVDNIVHQHEGFIEVTSEVGKGSRFDIYLLIRTSAPTVDMLPPEMSAGL